MGAMVTLLALASRAAGCPAEPRIGQEGPCPVVTLPTCPRSRSLLTQLATQGQPRPLQAPPAEVTAPGASWRPGTLQTEAHCSPHPSRWQPPPLTGLLPDGRVAGHQLFFKNQMSEFLCSFGQATRTLQLLALAGDKVVLGPFLPPSGAAPGPQRRPPWSHHR